MLKTSSAILLDKILPVLLLCIAWEILHLYSGKGLIFPSVFEIAKTGMHLVTTERFWEAYGHTLKILMISWGMACVSVSIAVLICFYFDAIRSIFEKYCSYFMPLPTLTLLPFLTLLLGLNVMTIQVLLVLSIFFSMSYQILKIFDNVRLTWEKQAKNLRWNTLRSIRHIYLHAAAPSIFGVVSISWTQMWRVLITLEIAFGAIGGYFGLGSWLIDVRTKLDIAEMYAVLFSIAMTGVLVNGFLTHLSKKFVW